MVVTELTALKLQGMIMMLFKTESMKSYPVTVAATQVVSPLICWLVKSSVVTGVTDRIEKTDLKELDMTITQYKDE